MKEYRCRFCHKLLFEITQEAIDDTKQSNNPVLKIKCPKCKKLNALDLRTE